MNKNSTVWISLLALTLFTFLLGWYNLISELFVSFVLIITFIKGQLIIDYFMDLKNVEFKWKIIPTLWLLVIILMIAAAYYFPIPTQGLS